MPYVQSPNYSKGRTKPIRGIVLHTIVGSANSAIQHFKNPASQVSAHYVIALDGTVTQMVDDGDRAWHAGIQSNNVTMFRDPNGETIGIEHDDGGDPAGSPRSDALYNASGTLVGQLCKRYNIPIDTNHIVYHRQIRSTKTCPGNLDRDRIVKIAKGDEVTQEEYDQRKRAIYENIVNGWYLNYLKRQGSQQEIDAHVQSMLSTSPEKYQASEWINRQKNEAEFKKNWGVNINDIKNKIINFIGGL